MSRLGWVGDRQRDADREAIVSGTLTGQRWAIGRTDVVQRPAGRPLGDVPARIPTMRPEPIRAGGGAVFIGDRDGNIDVYVDAKAAGDALEVIDVEDGEYPSAYRVDGAVLELLDDDGLAVADLTGGVDEQGLRSLISQYTLRRSTAPASSPPLDYAEAWLRAEWEFQRSRWPRWLRRRLGPASPPTREELAAPLGAPSPRLVRPWLLRGLVDEVLASLPEGAVSVVEGAVGGDATLHLVPRAAGAVDVMLSYGLTRVDVCVADSAPIEITAPENVNYGPPDRFWQDDVRDVVRAVSRGEALVALDAHGMADMVEIPGGRLGVTVHGRPRQPTSRPAAWDQPPPAEVAG